MATDEAIRKTVQRYVDAETTGDREAWVGLFAPDARFEDPVGSPVRVGHDQLREFWDETRKAFPSMKVTLVHGPAVCGNEAAYAVEAVVEMDGVSTIVPAIDIASFDDQGRFSSVRVFWDAVGPHPA